jgi:hypothetical protein
LTPCGAQEIFAVVKERTECKKTSKSSVHEIVKNEVNQMYEKLKGEMENFIRGLFDQQRLFNEEYAAATPTRVIQGRTTEFVVNHVNTSTNNDTVLALSDCEIEENVKTSSESGEEIPFSPIPISDKSLDSNKLSSVYRHLQLTHPDQVEE